MNDIFRVIKNAWNLRDFNLLENHNPRSKKCGLECIAYRANQVGKLFPLKWRDSTLLKISRHEIKTCYSNFASKLLLQALHSPLRIYLNVIIAFIVIFFDGLIYAKI